MPFSSTPVIVSPGDTIEIRYPVPSTWDTSVTFQVKIGEGTDNITVATRVPDSKPNSFSFQDQYASTNSSAVLPGDFVTTIQRNTTYYSQLINVSGVDLRVPIRIQSSASGPKNPSYPNLASSAAYSINGGSYITESNSFVAVSGTATLGSTSITVSTTTGLAVGMYIITPRITGEILSIAGNLVTLTNPASSSGSTSGNAYFTVKNGDTVRLRVTTENWYTTNSNVTLILSDNYWNAGDQTSDTWSITTRAQDQTISTLVSNTFTDYIDVLSSSFGTYKTTNISILGIDSDVVLEATSTGNMQISKNNSTWSQNVQDLVLGNTLYVRTAVGSNYTTKTSGTLTVFANPGDTFTGGYENNTVGTYGTGVFQVSQTQGTATDNQQIWTEVDRYPNPISLTPVYTYSDEIVLNQSQAGEGYISDVVYTTTNLSDPSATGLTVKAISVGPQGQLGIIEVVERGSGYQENDVLRINGGTSGNLAQYFIEQYRKVTVSTTNTVPNAEIDRFYYADIPVSGLGIEYGDGSYSDLESPYVTSGSNPTLPISTSGVNLNGSTVQIQVLVSQGAGSIRKNNTGSWVQQLFVQNSDILNFRLKSSSDYDTTLSSRITFAGPPSGGPAGNPTLGPNPPAVQDLTDIVSLTTRSPRVTPRKFRAEPVFDALPGQTVTATIPIEGLDANSTISIVSSTPFSNPLVSSNGTLFQSSATLTTSSTSAFVRLTAGAAGSIRKVRYRIGSGSTYVEDDFVVIARKTNYTYLTYDSGFNGVVFLPSWTELLDVYVVGAGGGKGGSDLPNSFGGSGAAGNILAGQINIPTENWPDPYARRVKVIVGEPGTDGEDFAQFAIPGTGGFGWRNGGDGGYGSTDEYSGAGGGGGGASAIEILNTDGVSVLQTLLVAGGGAGGGGAGSDTTPNKASQDGNQGLGGGSLSLLSSTPSANGQSAGTFGGGGGGGGGGGWGNGGSINTQLLDSSGAVIATQDLDAKGGLGGGWYYNSSNFTLDTGVLNPGENGASPGSGGFVVIGYPPQDKTADPFSFDPLNDIEPSSTVESNIVRITGISGTVPVGVTSNGVNVGIRSSSSPTSITSEPFTSGVTIQNQDYIQIQMTLGSLYNSSYIAEVEVGDTPPVQWFVGTSDPPDTTPSSFIFTNLEEQQINTLIQSEQVDIGGINRTVFVTASNGAEVRVGTEISPGVWTYSNYQISDPSNPTVTINGGQRLQVRILSSPDYSTSVSTGVQVGNSDVVTWQVTTEVEPDTTPDSFLFITIEELDPLTQVFSNYASIEGFSTSTLLFTVGPDPVSGIQAFIELNGIQTGLSTVNVQEFDLVRLYFTTSSVPGETNVFPVTAGQYVTSWTASNAGSFGTTPDEFTFGADSTNSPGVAVTSTLIVTISGIGDPNGVPVYSTTSGMLLSINGGPFTSYTILSPFFPANNGTTVRARLTSPVFAGFSKVGNVVIGSGTGTFTVFTNAPPQEPILGQWYSSLNVVLNNNNNPIKLNTKFDGLPVGTMMPVFKENNVSNSSSFGQLDGGPTSRFPGFIYCDGQMLFPDDYPLLYEVLGNTYGADFAGRFRLPDMRNKKVVGTGPVDGQQASSPALSPDFGPSKSVSLRNNLRPGSHGGMWFIDTIDSPSDQVITQVNQPATGLPATESQFFDIASIRTTGYSSILGDVEFITSGQVSAPISLKSSQQFEVPSHQHELLTGVPDPAFKGRVAWNSDGGYSNKLPTTNRNGESSPANVSTITQINIWGFATTDISLGDSDTIDTTSEPKSGPVWIRQISTWNPNSFTDGYLGQYINQTWPTVNYIQNGLESGTSNYNEINSYINLSSSPFPGPNNGGDVYKWVAALDIPRRQISIDQFRPNEKLQHTHFITLQNISNNDGTIFSYGNVNDHGTAYGLTPSNTSLNIVFTASQLGLEVLPGTFKLNETKQLIPTPSFAPQTKVGLITPYIWCKWLIKAY